MSVIATTADQCDTIRSQLGPQVQLVPEPERRDTFPAILLSLAYLKSRLELKPEEPVLVLPVDSLAEDRFYEQIFLLPKLLEKTEANLVLLGIKPSEPSSKYGYMIPAPAGGLGGAEAIRVDCFYEKPDTDLASALIRKGALWNSGVFCFRAGYVLDLLRSQRLPDTYEELCGQYSRVDRQSFDHAVVEKEKNISALVYDGLWRDLGTWCSFTEVMRQPIIGAGLITDDCRDVHVINQTEIPVIATGVHDIVVAASRDGVLISHKRAASGLKSVLQSIPSRIGPVTRQANGISADTLDYTLLPDGTAVTTRRVRVEQGSSLVQGKPDEGRRSVSWTLLQGRSTLNVNGRERHVLPGTTITLNHDDTAELTASELLELIEVSTIYRG